MSKRERAVTDGVAAGLNRQMHKPPPMRAAIATLLALLALAPAAGAAEPASAPATNRIGMHSILTPGDPYSAKEVMFREAAAAGASTIRVDIQLNAIFLLGEYRGRPISAERWTETDQFSALASRYGLRVLGVLYGTPARIADCPAGTPEAEAYRCPPADIPRYKEMVAKVAARYAGTIDEFEILNEPDESRYFTGDPSQYARTLSAAADAIHGANPRARVALGGVSNIDSTAFVDAVLAADPSVAGKVDINTIHLRSSATGTARLTAQWRSYFDSKGMKGPLWMTEFGYPADPAYQFDPSFKGGEASQAEFLKVSMPWVVGAGGDMLFITERDWGSGAFASEGILESPNPLTANPQVRRRAAFDVVKAAASSLEGSFPPGRSVYQQPAGSRLKVRKGRISIRFGCVSAGDCPARAVRMKLKGGGTMRVETPFVVSGGRAYATPKFSAYSRKLIRRAGRRGIRATVTDFKLNVLGTFTIVR